MRPAPAAAAAAAAALTAPRLGRWLLPPSPMPRPTGPHPVGTAVTAVEGPRHLPVQIWYPAAGAEGPAARLFPAPDAPAVVARRYGLPPWALRPLGRVAGHAIAGVPADPAAIRGVALLVHGWLGFRTIHTDLAEQLASDGWVVLAADHVGGALVAQYPDHRVVGVDEALLPPVGDPDRGPRSRVLVDTYAGDLAAVLDAGLHLPEVGLDIPEPADVLVIGQSTGGGAAVLLAARDPRVTRLVGLDPWVEPVDVDLLASVDVPLVAIRSGGWVGGGNDRLLARIADVELRAVPEAGHTDLTALGYLTPLLRLTGLSRCDPSLPHDAAVRAIADVTA